MSNPIPSLPEGFDDYVLAQEGMVILLNNGLTEADTLFEKFKNCSPLLHAGSSFVQFMQGLLTFEDKKLDKALTALKETQKICNAIDSSDLFDNFKSKFRRKRSIKKASSVESVLQRKIIIGDCYLYIAVICFIKQEVTGYIKGGWNLRKAWKIYDKCHRQIIQLLEKHNIEYTKPDEAVELGFVNGTQTSSEADEDDDDAEFVMVSRHRSTHVGQSSNSRKGSIRRSESQPDPRPRSASTNSSVERHESSDGSLDRIDIDADSGSVEPGAVLRLYGAVSFGFGCFNLCVSLIPQHLLRVVNMIGFNGDRSVGLRALDVAAESQDMKAPLAMLALLWYHTVVRPFFAVDGDDGGSACAGIPDAERILAKNEGKYPSSAFVLFFKGRVYRCKRDINNALVALQASYDAAAIQGELQLLCAYELGWCCIMQMKWTEALSNINRLRENSNWSVSYYTYLTALLHGALCQAEDCRRLMATVPKLVKRKNNNLEVYVTRKSKSFAKFVDKDLEAHAIMFLFEILYLWSALSSCDDASLNAMLQECRRLGVSRALHHFLVAGIHKALRNHDKALGHYQQTVKLSETDQWDSHIAPYACYEIALMYIASPDTKSKGVQLLTECKESFSGYDFENRLLMRLHATNTRIKHEQEHRAVRKS